MNLQILIVILLLALMVLQIFRLLAPPVNTDIIIKSLMSILATATAKCGTANISFTRECINIYYLPRDTSEDDEENETVQD